MGARRPCTPAPPIDSALPLPVEDRPLWAPGGPAPPPRPSTLPSHFLRRTGPCGRQAALRHSVRAGAAHRPGAKPARSSIPWAARWPSGGQPQDHPSLQISRLRPPDLGVPAFQKPVPHTAARATRLFSLQFYGKNIFITKPPPRPSSLARLAEKEVDDPYIRTPSLSINFIIYIAFLKFIGTTLCAPGQSPLTDSGILLHLLLRGTL